MPSGVSHDFDQFTMKELLLKIRDWYKYLLSKRKIFFICVLIGFLFGIIVSLLYKPKYKAVLTFVLENNGKSKLGSYSGIAAQFGLSLGTDAGGLFIDNDNVMAFMKSQSMIIKTLRSEREFNDKKQLLVERYVESKDLMRKIGTKFPTLHFHKNSENTSIIEDSLLMVFYKDIIENDLSVYQPDKKTDIIAITTSSTDQLFAKSFTENLLENVIEFYITTQTKKSQENVSILQRQTDSVKSLLNIALSGVATSTDANPNPNPAFQRLRVPSQKKMVDVEMNKEILGELVKHLELAKITLRKETPLVQIIDTPLLPLEKKKIGILKGIILGSLSMGLLAILFLSFKLYFKRLLA